MEEVELSLRLGIGNGGVLHSSDARNREWRSSSQVRCLESETEEFKPSSDAWKVKFDA